MSSVVLIALLVSIVIYMIIGITLSKTTRELGDMIPLVFGKQASVNSTGEFSASTVAATISLATVIVAYFELVPAFGIWLMWTVLTTSLGFILLWFLAPRIWSKMMEYDHRPTLHEFLGTEFHSPVVAMVGAICTSIGFLLIFAVELSVGSRFLSALIPEIPEWLTVICLSLTGFAYTSLGGFRAVIRTDILQMRFIWLMLVALIIFFVVTICQSHNPLLLLKKIPPDIYNFSYREGLIAFIAGVFVMNIPTHITNMSIWQRISAAQKPAFVVKGIFRSALGSAASWGLLVILACGAMMFVAPQKGENLLNVLLIFMSKSLLGQILVFCVVLGLLGAMLSTASTQLIVVSHTLYEDVFSKLRKSKLSERLNVKKELLYSRILLISTAILAVGIVEILKYSGFSIADLVFAIYGGQLVLFQSIIIALYGNREKLRPLANTANIAIIAGFVTGWGSAILGNFLNVENMVFLAPVMSIGTSFVIFSVSKLIQNFSKK